MPARDMAAYLRTWRRARLSDPLRKRLLLGDHLKTYYGITLKQYDQLLRNQHDRCAVCRRLPKDGKRLHVDHDHQTGQVRGLLCGGCNAALGCMEENPLFIGMLADYAESCVQRRARYRADPGDPGRHSMAEMLVADRYHENPARPYLVNALRESLQRLYGTRPVKKPVKRGTPKPYVVPSAALVGAGL